MQLVENSKKCQIIKFNNFLQIQFCQVKLKVCFPNGNCELLTIISLYNPQNGLFWWDYRECDSGEEDNVIDSFLKSWLIHISEHVIVCFRLRKFGILFRASCEHYEVFDESYKNVISTLKTHAEEIEKCGFLFRLTKWYSKIDLNKHIPRAIIKFCDPWGMLSKPKIKMEITQQNSQQWHIELTFISPSSKKHQSISQPENEFENNQRKTTLILNDDFEVLDVIIK